MFTIQKVLGTLGMNLAVFHTQTMNKRPTWVLILQIKMSIELINVVTLRRLINGIYG